MQMKFSTGNIETSTRAVTGIACLIILAMLSLSRGIKALLRTYMQNLNQEFSEFKKRNYSVKIHALV